MENERLDHALAFYSREIEKEERNIKAKEYYQKNRERHNKQMKEWRKNNPDYMKEYNKQYHKKTLRK